MSLRSSFGFTQEATASQKNIKSCLREEMCINIYDSSSERSTMAESHLHNTSGIYSDHCANSPECGIFLLIVSYVSK